MTVVVPPQGLRRQEDLSPADVELTIKALTEAKDCAQAHYDEHADAAYSTRVIRVLPTPNDRNP